jgi:trk system potassium uptake protein TrkH
MKIIRLQVMFKLIHRNFYKRLHPRAVVAARLGDRTVSAETASNITVFILMYFVTMAVGALLISLDGKDAMTALSASASMLSNNSVGFGEIGYGSAYNIFSPPVRLLLAFMMIAGRLELFTVFILLTPSYWRTDRK